MQVYKLSNEQKRIWTAAQINRSAAWAQEKRNYFRI